MTTDTLNSLPWCLCGVQVADMLLELCVTELEDVATDSQSGRLSSQPVVVESSHPYTDDTSTSGTVKIPGKKTQAFVGPSQFRCDRSVGYKHLPLCSVGAEGLRIEFDRQCSTERRHDPLTIMDGANRIVSVRSGDERKRLNLTVTKYKLCQSTKSCKKV